MFRPDPSIMLGTTRRQFIKLGAMVGGGVFIAGRVGGYHCLLAAPLPGGTLVPTDITKYAAPLLIPPVMPRAGAVKLTGGKQADYYEISVRQFAQQILPAALPATTVWGYGPVAGASNRAVLIHNAPSLTIEAQWRRPVRIKWINELVDESGNFLPHLLPVDQTLHWANPPGGNSRRDTRPSFVTTPPAYAGPVPIVTHVHGAVGVGDESDGYAEAWYLPDANNIPSEYAREGTWYDFFHQKAASQFGVKWQRGDAVFQYPNGNRASTLWYHDHALGITRLNVYAGPAGFYIVRGGPAGDDAVLDRSTGQTAVLPGPAPRANDKFPPNKTYREIPLAIQDRAFNTDGSLFYPDARAFFDEFAGPFIPHSDVAPIWNPEFFGNCIMVNGRTWPFLPVEQSRYRLRVLNGCQSRFLILDFSDIPGVDVWQIGNEGGFLAAALHVTGEQGHRLLLGPAERADLIVDFANVPIGSHVLRNVGPDEPFGGGTPGVDFEPADPDSTGQIMRFDVTPSMSVDQTTPPRFLQLPAIAAMPPVTTTRRLALLEEMSTVTDGPAAAMLGAIGVDDRPIHRMWSDPVSENPAVGNVEMWEFYNLTEDAHPMHVHEVTFEVVNREPLIVGEAGEHEAQAPVQLAGSPRPPEASETGVKDTVIAYPGEVTRIRAQFDTPGQFVWHCHIVEHEDHEMMRPYRIGPEQPGQPRQQTDE